MANVNKTDRKKLASTSVIDTLVIWHDARDGSEFARLDVTKLDDRMRDKLCIYGAKQIAADIVAGVAGADKKIAGMKEAVATLLMGYWPRRTSERDLGPAMERAIVAIMATQAIDRNAARGMLGLGAE